LTNSPIFLHIGGDSDLQAKSGKLKAFLKEVDAA
jgi:hypothetical protein